MMGACFECLVEIDGITRQACMVDVEDGLVIETVKTPGGV
jgi:predicted molibdopterin-dependent oxidoreductase YjgC